MARQFKPGQLQTGSLFNISSSYALTASFALNGGGGATFPYTGSAIISGSLGVTGSTSIRGTLNQASASLATGLFAHAQGISVTASGAYSHAEGQSNIAIGDASHAEGQLTTANGPYSHAEGYGTITNGFASHTEGQSNVATGQASHAEGGGTTANGTFSHAEGYGTTATGQSSHAEGNTTTATGEGSHAEGSSTVANGQYSHAEGLGTIAQGAYQHVQGQYNQSSSAQGAFIHGNGTADGLRSNLIFASGSRVQITGSVIATAGFTGSLQGTASLATFATTANFAANAGHATTAITADQPSGDWIPAKPDGHGFSPYNLGSPTAAWNSLYVNHGTIYFLSESVGNPTTSGSLSIVDDPIEGSRFVLGTRDAVGQKKEIVISDKGASLAISASIAQTASYISPTFISQSAAASGFGAGGGSITYVSSSNNPLSEIEVADYDSNVAVTFVNGRLKFIFGTPTTPSAPVASFNSTFITDRFNKVTDPYTVTGTIAVGGYTLISASLYEGGVLLTSTGSNATQLLYSTTTSGSHTYVLHVTASSPLDNSLNIQSASLSGTLSKTNPGVPTITPTATVQLGTAASLQIEQGATGSITFTSASGTANNWVHNFTSTNVTSPIFVTGSATGSSSITATATSYYSSSGVLGADNFLALATTSTFPFTYTKIRSVRYGVSAATAFTSTQLENLATWDTTIGGTIGRVVKGTTNPHTYQFTITTSGQYIYIVVDSSYSLTGILNVNNSNSNDLGVFTATTIGNYKVYRSNNISATTILYELRTS